VAKVRFISLPNLIADEKIVEELLQHDCNTEKITNELNLLLHSKNQRFYNSLIEKIGEKGASQKAARLVCNLIGK